MTSDNKALMKRARKMNKKHYAVQALSSKLVQCIEEINALEDNKLKIIEKIDKALKGADMEEFQEYISDSVAYRNKLPHHIK